MSRNELPERSPEGIDDRTWFYIHETFRKYDAALSRLDDSVSGVVNAEPGSAAPAQVIGYTTPGGVEALATNVAGTKVTGPLMCGEFGGGFLEADATEFPGGQPSLGWKSSPDDLVSYHSVGSWTFTASPSTMVGKLADFNLVGTIPPGFTGWGSVAVRVYYGLLFSGVSGGSAATATLFAVGNTGNASSAITTDEAGGAISDPYTAGPAVELTRSQLEALQESFRPGDPLRLLLRFSCTSSTGTSGATLDVGRVELNWK